MYVYIYFFVGTMNVYERSSNDDDDSSFYFDF